MADNTSSVAGMYGLGKTYTAILDEGAITITTDVDAYGREQTVYPGASPVPEGFPVALVNSSENTFTATGGNILVESPVNAEGLVIGRIVGTPTGRQKSPATAAAADSLTKRLSGKYFKQARLELLVPHECIKKAKVVCDGTNATIPGVGTTLKVDTSASLADRGLVFVQCASGGTGVIPLHYVPAGTAGDTYTIGVIITGLMTSLD